MNASASPGDNVILNNGLLEIQELRGPDHPEGKKRLDEYVEEGIIKPVTGDQVVYRLKQTGGNAGSSNSSAAQAGGRDDSGPQVAVLGSSKVPVGLSSALGYLHLGQMAKVKVPAHLMTQGAADDSGAFKDLPASQSAPTPPASPPTSPVSVPTPARTAAGASPSHTQLTASTRRQQQPAGRAAAAPAHQQHSRGGRDEPPTPASSPQVGGFVLPQSMSEPGQLRQQGSLEGRAHRDPMYMHPQQQPQHSMPGDVNIVYPHSMQPPAQRRSKSPNASGAAASAAAAGTDESAVAAAAAMMSGVPHSGVAAVPSHHLDPIPSDEAIQASSTGSSRSSLGDVSAAAQPGQPGSAPSAAARAGAGNGVSNSDSSSGKATGGYLSPVHRKPQAAIAGAPGSSALPGTGSSSTSGPVSSRDALPFSALRSHGNTAAVQASSSTGQQAALAVPATTSAEAKHSSADDVRTAEADGFHTPQSSAYYSASSTPAGSVTSESPSLSLSSPSPAALGHAAGGSSRSPMLAGGSSAAAATGATTAAARQTLQHGERESSSTATRSSVGRVMFADQASQGKAAANATEGAAAAGRAGGGGGGFHPPKPEALLKAAAAKLKLYGSSGKEQQQQEQLPQQQQQGMLQEQPGAGRGTSVQQHMLHIQRQHSAQGAIQQLGNTGGTAGVGSTGVTQSSLTSGSLTSTAPAAARGQQQLQQQQQQQQSYPEIEVLHKPVPPPALRSTSSSNAVPEVKLLGKADSASSGSSPFLQPVSSNAPGSPTPAAAARSSAPGPDAGWGERVGLSTPIGQLQRQQQQQGAAGAAASHATATTGSSSDGSALAAAGWGDLGSQVSQPRSPRQQQVPNIGRSPPHNLGGQPGQVVLTGRGATPGVTSSIDTASFKAWMGSEPETPVSPVTPAGGAAAAAPKGPFEIEAWQAADSGDVADVATSPYPANSPKRDQQQDQGPKQHKSADVHDGTTSSSSSRHATSAHAPATADTAAGGDSSSTAAAGGAGADADARGGGGAPGGAQDKVEYEVEVLAIVPGRGKLSGQPLLSEAAEQQPLDIRALTDQTEPHLRPPKPMKGVSGWMRRHLSVNYDAPWRAGKRGLGWLGLRGCFTGGQGGEKEKDEHRQA